MNSYILQRIHELFQCTWACGPHICRCRLVLTPLNYQMLITNYQQQAVLARQACHIITGESTKPYWLSLDLLVAVHRQHQSLCFFMFGSELDTMLIFYVSVLGISRNPGTAFQATSIMPWFLYRDRQWQQYPAQKHVVEVVTKSKPAKGE